MLSESSSLLCTSPAALGAPGPTPSCVCGQRPPTLPSMLSKCKVIDECHADLRHGPRKPIRTLYMR